MGRSACAFVELAEGFEPEAPKSSEAELLDHAAKGLAGFQRPKR